MAEENLGTAGLFSIEQIASTNNFYLVKLYTNDAVNSCKFMHALVDIKEKQPKRLIFDLTAVTQKKDWVICGQAASSMTGIDTRYFGINSGEFSDESFDGKPSYRARVSPRIYASLEEALK